MGWENCASLPLTNVWVWQNRFHLLCVFVTIICPFACKIKLTQTSTQSIARRLWQGAATDAWVSDRDECKGEAMPNWLDAEDRHPSQNDPRARRPLE